MSTSLESVPLKYRSNSDYLASLPPWRRLLAKLNWHPVRGTEIETWRSRIETERLRIETEQIRRETEQIKKETEQIRREAEQIRSETAQLRSERAQLRRDSEQEEQEWNRLRQIDAQIEALFCSEGSCSTPAESIDNSSRPS